MKRALRAVGLRAAGAFLSLILRLIPLETIRRFADVTAPFKKENK